MIQSNTPTTSDIVMRIRGVGKAYTIKRGVENQSTLAEQTLQRLRNPFKRANKDTFWALQDVDLDIKQGDVVGIIGRNGAGKSTLLKVLSRITYPTTGEIDIYGRVGSLLEVGTGFHPELTGRENIFLNGAVLGMTRPEIKKEFDAIVDFAGVEKFLETPVKRYSSGMYVRLAFAVAAHLRTEILIVDEVLAVGDAGFQAKCLGKMKDVADSQGRTVLFVSHQMQSVHTLCTSAVYLSSGKIVYQGATDQAIEYYQAGFSDQNGKDVKTSNRKGGGAFRFDSVHVGKDLYRGDEVKTVKFSFSPVSPASTDIQSMWIASEIVNDMGVTILQLDSRLHGLTFSGGAGRSGELAIRSPWMKPGQYRVNMYLCAPGGIEDIYEDAAVLSISELLPYSHDAGENGIRNGLVFSDFEWQLD